MTIYKLIDKAAAFYARKPTRNTLVTVVVLTLAIAAGHSTTEPIPIVAPVAPVAPITAIATPQPIAIVAPVAPTPKPVVKASPEPVAVAAPVLQNWETYRDVFTAKMRQTASAKAMMSINTRTEEGWQYMLEHCQNAPGIPEYDQEGIYALEPLDPRYSLETDVKRTFIANEGTWPMEEIVVVFTAEASTCEEIFPNALRAERITPVQPVEFGRVGTLVAASSNARINLRSQPSSDVSTRRYGLVGDRVLVQDSVADNDGNTWYKVQFSESKAVGWIRGDFISF